MAIIAMNSIPGNERVVQRGPLAASSRHDLYRARETPECMCASRVLGRTALTRRRRLDPLNVEGLWAELQQGLRQRESEASKQECHTGPLLIHGIIANTSSVSRGHWLFGYAI